MAVHKWSDVRGRKAPEVEAQIEQAKSDIRRAMRLADVRRAREMTQVTLAEAMGVPQGEVSKIERRQDVYLSTLRRFIEAMGGELVLAARFPDEELPISLGDEMSST